MATVDQGRRGESLAVSFLEDHGYRLVQRNYRVRQGEVDLVALDGDVLCFVEVRSKRNATFGDPLETIDHKKQRRIIYAAKHFLLTHPGLKYDTIRFDAVGIVYEPAPNVRLIRGAFEAGLYD